MENANPPSTFESISRQPLATDMEQKLEAMKCQFDLLIKEAVSLDRWSKNLRQAFPEPPRQEEFEGIIISFIRNQEGELRQLEEYMSIIGGEVMQLSLLVMEKLKDKIRTKENKMIQKITRFPETKKLESSDTGKSVESIVIKTPSLCLNLLPSKHVCKEPDKMTIWLEDRLRNQDQSVETASGKLVT
nr:hypothetical protein [Tanacetum cinerariifolium]